MSRSCVSVSVGSMLGSLVVKHLDVHVPYCLDLRAVSRHLYQAYVPV